MSQICPRYVLEMSQICPRYVPDMFKKCPIYVPEYFIVFPSPEKGGMTGASSKGRVSLVSAKRCD